MARRVSTFLLWGHNELSPLCFTAFCLPC